MAYPIIQEHTEQTTFQVNKSLNNSETKKTHHVIFIFTSLLAKVKKYTYIYGVISFAFKTTDQYDKYCY